ncbi:MAG: MobF family relaxase [Acidimicrobiales bacterium]
MLSIGELNAAQVAQDHLAMVASSPLDYYAGRGEAEGAWVGGGAELLGLSGGVCREQLEALLAGDHPTTGESLVLSKARRTRAAFDLTFSAPKGVSLLATLGAAETSAVVSAAHAQAVNDALGYIERRALAVRRGHDGVEQLRGLGLVGAAFVHRSSRAGDPQLHTHVVVPNVVPGEDGRWSAPDARLFYRHARTAGFLYQASLRAELTRKLGVEWRPTRKGMAEPAAFTAGQLREFSTRRAQIVAELAKRGQTSAPAAREVTLATRPRKEPEATADIERWRERAATVGLTARTLDAMRGPQRPAGFTRRDARALSGELLGAVGLTAHASRFDRATVLRAVAQAARDGATVADVEHLADAVLAFDDAVALDPEPSGRIGDDIDGFSTLELLQTEARLLAHADGRKATGVAVVEDTHLAACITASAAVSAEQAAMVRRITTSGDGVEVVVGRAGTGKTTAMAVAADAWRRQGFEVVGVALAARAAAELHRSAGITSTTIARFELEMSRPEAIIRAGTVVVVDEAGLVGTRALARLSDLAAKAEAKLVLVGDPRQLPEIDAGGAFGALAHHLHAAELTVTARQRHEWERRVLDDLRHGSVERAVHAYETHDRLHVFADVDATRRAMVADWLAVATAGRLEPMITDRRTEVAALNALARAELATAGLIGEVDLVVGEVAFAERDLVIPQRNDHAAGLRNGELCTVTEVSSDGLRVVDADGLLHEVRLDYLAAGHLAHGYATTVHKAQGMTSETQFVETSDATRREHAYVAASRAREATHLYLTDPIDRRADIAHADERTAERTPAEELAAAWSRSGAQRLALPGAAPDPLGDHIMAAVLAADLPAVFAARLGPPPEPGRARDAWDRAAAAASAYRTRWGITTTDDLLGPRPTDAQRIAQRFERERAARLLGEADRRLGRGRSEGLGL